MWDKIKYALNSRIGIHNFKPLDKIVEEQSHECYYSTMESYVSTYGDNNGKIVVIPRGTVEISNSYFDQNIIIQCAVLPNGLKKIGENAFTDSSIKTIKIPNSVNEIGIGAFGGSALTSIDLPEGIKELKDFLFNSCRNLRRIVLPSTITKIGTNGVFSACDNLASVKILSKTPPALENDVFESSPVSNATLYVPKGSRSLYINSNYWNKFGEIIEI